jgi:hypothetical protein
MWLDFFTRLAGIMKKSANEECKPRTLQARGTLYDEREKARPKFSREWMLMFVG